MTIFNSYVKLPEGTSLWNNDLLNMAIFHFAVLIYQRADQNVGGPHATKTALRNWPYILMRLHVTYRSDEHILDGKYSFIS
jgi:hypothetical protein